MPHYHVVIEGAVTCVAELETATDAYRAAIAAWQAGRPACRYDGTPYGECAEHPAAAVRDHPCQACEDRRSALEALNHLADRPLPGGHYFRAGRSIYRLARQKTPYTDCYRAGGSP
ncbi:hypothetical protein [Actinomadura sp. K4S16]|uniref:hypothetical protein n=1 Tax=Actinomadura sp. K4S16 TaxID=1316147 RepID=UPI0011EFBEEF|nr:hypothetical protein [Actinomadura sp. K4S16]